MQNRTVKCPTCQKPTVYAESNPYRPFCSERCKTADIAAWATEEYRVPSQEPVSEFDLEDLVDDETH